jgi:hypothetical protein
LKCPSWSKSCSHRGPQQMAARNPIGIGTAFEAALACRGIAQAPFPHNGQPGMLRSPPPALRHPGDRMTQPAERSRLETCVPSNGPLVTAATRLRRSMDFGDRNPPSRSCSERSSFSRRRARKGTTSVESRARFAPVGLWRRLRIGASRLGSRQTFLPKMTGRYAAAQGQRLRVIEELRTVQSRTDPSPSLSKFRLYVPFPADQPPGGNVELVPRNRQLGVSIVGERPRWE